MVTEGKIIIIIVVFTVVHSDSHQSFDLQGTARHPLSDTGSACSLPALRLRIYHINREINKFIKK